MSHSDVVVEPSAAAADPWELFLGATTEESFFQGWLLLLSRNISAAVQGVVLSRGSEGPYIPRALWPSQGAAPQRLAQVLERVIEERCGLVLHLDDETQHFAIAYPLLLDDALPAVVAMEIIAGGEDDLRRAMAQLQWGIAWLEVLYRRQQAGEDGATLHRLRTAVDLLAVTLGEGDFPTATLSFVTELAAACNCDRVSLGLVRGQNIDLAAISHSVEVAEKMNLTSAIVQAMDEALLQRCEVLYPAHHGSEVHIDRNHEHLSRLQNQANIASFPLFQQEHYFAVLTCERPADQPFTAGDLSLIRSVAALVSPALENKELNARPLWRVVQQAATLQLTRITGPGYVGRKLALATGAALLLVAALASGEYRLSATTTLEGSVRRAVVAPFDGYIDQAPSRAGDLVAKDTLLCTLDDRDLRLERLARFSQKSQLQRQHQSAVAKYDRAQANIIEAQLDQAGAELELVEAKLQRTRLQAPFAGLLVSGDLSQRLGSAVAKGEVLFELTPLDSYRVILEIDERRIGDVRIGQQGTLVLASQPATPYAFTISKLTPITTAKDGRNFFRVEAQLATVADTLRPGMEGVGKISIDRRRLVRIWSRELIEWVRLWCWRWLP
jgi:multidrug efflux pump subunit AcrA (membrane-fusion protein)